MNELLAIAGLLIFAPLMLFEALILFLVWWSHP